MRTSSSSCSVGSPGYGQNENAMSMAVRDSDFCRLSLTPRDYIRVGHLQVRGGEVGRESMGVTGRAGARALCEESIRRYYTITFVRFSQLQLKTGGVAQVYTVESLQRQNTQIREYNSALEDPVRSLHV